MHLVGVTHAGRAVLDPLRRAGLKPTSISVGSALGARQGGTAVQVGEQELAARIAIVLGEDRLQVDPAMDGAQDLALQLERYTSAKLPRPTAGASAFLRPERQELVRALALGLSPAAGVAGEGPIAVRGKTYASWSDYYQSPAYLAAPLRCGTPDPFARERAHESRAPGTSTLGAIIRAGAATACRPWPRFVLDARAWDALAAVPDAGAAEGMALLALWAEPGFVHAAFQENTGSILLATRVATDGRYPALSASWPAAAPCERMVHDLWGLSATGGTDARPMLDHGRWAVSNG